jgi:hypothetical protein
MAPRTCRGNGGVDNDEGFTASPGARPLAFGKCCPFNVKHPTIGTRAQKVPDRCSEKCQRMAPGH